MRFPPQLLAMVRIILPLLLAAQALLVAGRPLRQDQQVDIAPRHAEGMIVKAVDSPQGM